MEEDRRKTEEALSHVINRTADWDNPRSLAKAIQRLNHMTGGTFKLSVSGKYAMLKTPRGAITSYMAISELRAFVEGMLVTM